MICLICSSPSEIHHVMSRKAMGNNPSLYDQYWNRMELCREHHTMIHKIGRSSFVKKYDLVKFWMESKGWKQNFLGKWWHPEALKIPSDIQFAYRDASLDAEIYGQGIMIVSGGKVKHVPVSDWNGIIQTKEEDEVF